MTTRGFTLIETLVAITIIALVILAPFEAIQHVIRAARVEKEQLIASSLAQEGLEYIRFIRTTNYLQNGAGSDYLSGIDNNKSAIFGNKDCLKKDGDCSIDPTADLAQAIQKCYSDSGKACDPLYINANGFYTQSNIGLSNTQTIYHRSFYIQQHDSNTPAYDTITVTVNWSDSGVAQTPVVLTENLYDWF